MTFIMLSLYILGMFTGALLFKIQQIRVGNETLKEKIKAASAKLNASSSLDDRMKRVREITEEQLDMLQRSDGPQKNSLDGRYKNRLNRTVKDLEEEKNDILRSILDDGHDPEITSMGPDGIVTKMKLSEFMVDNGISAAKTTKSDKAEEPKTRQVGKFTIYKGGKDDGSGSTTH